MLQLDKHWDNLEVLHLNREQPRAYYIPHADREAAKQRRRGQSPFYQTLNGAWSFQYVPNR
jgi:beta-galactosidase